MHERLGMRGGIVLASSSPRRAALLRQMGIPFRTRTPAVDERRRAGEPARAYVRRVALAKARAVAAGAQAKDAEAPVLAADTVVAAGRRIFGKPRGRADFESMFAALAGGAHLALTAVALRWGEREAVRLAAARVELRPVQPGEMRAYWETGEPRDKAGGYGIQGLGGIFVRAVQGSYGAVVGLPLAETELLLRDFGIDPWHWRRGAEDPAAAARRSG